MKKMILSICMVLSCCIMLTHTVNAEEYYYEEVIEEIYSSHYNRATQTKTGKKTVYVKNSSDTILWSVTVTGTFTYTGSSSTCTISSVNASSNDSRWKIASKSSSKSGNKASATATAKYYLDGSIISTLSKTTTLTCSATGILS